MLQGNAAGTFTRSLSAAGAGRFSWTANGGGFAAGTSPLTVQVNNGTGALTWGSTVGSQIVGLLVFGSFDSGQCGDFSERHQSERRRIAPSKS